MFKTWPSTQPQGLIRILEISVQSPRSKVGLGERLRPSQIESGPKDKKPSKIMKSMIKKRQKRLKINALHKSNINTSCFN